jgi:hypothetical protein
MLPFGETIPSIVPQRSDIPDRLVNYPVHFISSIVGMLLQWVQLHVSACICWPSSDYNTQYFLYCCCGLNLRIYKCHTKFLNKLVKCTTFVFIALRFPHLRLTLKNTGQVLCRAWYVSGPCITPSRSQANSITNLAYTAGYSR